MTKENKLALVVGFALILFVGILISDHFSTARTQQSADLLPPSDPLLEGAEEPDLLDFSVASTAGADQRPAPLLNTREILDPVRPAEQPTLRMPDLQQGEPARVALPAEDAAALPWHFHDVTSGQSLTAICRLYYGDASLVRELAAFNGLDDPDRLEVGTRLRIPAAGTLVRGGPPAAAAAAGAAAPPPARKQRSASGPARHTYTVQPGDVLGVIARRTLGTSRRWHELYDLNRDVLRDPDHVEAGTVLKLPD